MSRRERVACPDCGWSTYVNSDHDGYQGLDIANAVLADHQDSVHPDGSDPMSVIQVTARLFPYDTPSKDGREIASGAIHQLPPGGIPIFSAEDGSDLPVSAVVGGMTELREEDGWAVAEGHLRGDLLPKRLAAILAAGGTLDATFGATLDPHTVQGDRPLYVRSGRLREVRVSTSAQSVWEGAGLKATHPTEIPPGEGKEDHVPPDQHEQAVKAAMMSLNATLRPLQAAMEEMTQILAPAVQRLAESLVAHAEAIRLSQPMIKVTPPGFWEALYGKVPRAEWENRPTPPEGPEDWPQLPRDGRRAPSGCEVCEAEPDERHPADCPGA